ncbi:MAG TPA: nuclear transport factor 2 family protein [Solirubrobacterales bacterium]|nr:nuclear transport factor 2 family protein [Solirubrobacterales bacterium]
MTAESVVRTTVPRAEPGAAAKALMVSAPRPLSRATLGALARLSARSPLRRRLLVALVVTGLDVLNRRDLDALLRFYDPECEIRLGPGWPLDLDPVQRGHAGALAILAAWDEVGELSFVPEEILDMGGPAFALLVSVRMKGAASGADPRPLRSVWTYRLERGLIAGQTMRNDGWDAGAAELSEALAGSRLRRP